KKEFIRLRGLIKEKKIDFELYKDNISVPYLMFIFVRTCINILDEKDHYLLMYWNLETVKINQLQVMDHKLRKVLKGFKTDATFMEYTNSNENLIDLIEVKTQEEFIRTMFQVFKNFNSDKEKLDPKKDFSIEEIYAIIIKSRNSEYNKDTKMKKYNLILTYCIHDCQGSKEIYEKMFKNIKYLLMSKSTCITVQEYALKNKTKMINNIIADFSY
ncbi:6508_t:CDS:2, partial [Gigaspora margarita]